MKEFRTRISLFHADEHGIIHKKLIEGVNIMPEDIEEYLQMILSLTDGKKALLMVHAEPFHTLTPEAIKTLSENMAKSRYATALVSQSLGVRIFVDTLTAITKNDPPYRMFLTEKDALKWLLSIRNAIEVKGKPMLHNAAIAPVLRNKYTAAMPCKVDIDKNGILIKKIKKGSHINLHIAKKAEKEAVKLAGGKRVLALVDRSADYTITKEAIKFLQKNATAKYRIATALVFPRPGNVQPLPPSPKQAVPVRLFKNKSAAVKWLLSLKQSGTN